MSLWNTASHQVTHPRLRSLGYMLRIIFNYNETEGVILIEKGSHQPCVRVNRNSDSVEHLVLVTCFLQALVWISKSGFQES